MVDLWDRLEKLSRSKRALLLRQLNGLPTGKLAQSIPALAGRMSVEQMLAEATVDDKIDPQRSGVKQNATGSVLLTGATGYVGATVLDSITRMTECDIFCLIRAGSISEGRERIANNLEKYGLHVSAKRVIPVLGDLELPFLGLSPAVFESLSDSVGEVYHCAAIVNWILPYPLLRNANVFGTQETLRFAASGRLKPYHFVSTVGVFSSPEYPGETVSECEPLEASGALYVGYAQSKWISEKMVRNVAERGLPVTICRPNVGGYSNTGSFNPNDHLNLLLKGCIQLGMAPDLDLNVASAPADYVGDSIVELSKHASECARTFHLVNTPSMPWTKFVEWHGSRGYSLPIVSIKEWRTQLVSAVREGRDNALTRLLPMLTESALNLARLPLFDVARTQEALLKSTVRCPRLDDRLLDVWWKRQVESGFLPAPLVA